MNQYILMKCPDYQGALILASFPGRPTVQVKTLYRRPGNEAILISPYTGGGHFLYTHGEMYYILLPRQQLLWKRDM